MNTTILSIATMALVLLSNGISKAGLVVSSTATLVNETANNATLTINIYGVNDGSAANELVSTFGLNLTVSGVTPTISNATLAPSPSQWAAFNNRPMPNTSGSTVRFQSYRTPETDFVPISGTVQSSLTLIGSFSFSVNKTNASQAFTINASAGPALDQSNMEIGSGFLFRDTSFYTPIPTTYLSTSGTIAAITAVPEPSSFALLGLVSFSYLAMRRRATAGRKATSPITNTQF